MSDRDPNERPEQPAEAPSTEADRAHLRELQKARQARVAKVLVALAIIVLLVIFVVQNSDRVEIDFIFLSRRARLIWVLLVTALLGGIVGYLIGRPGKSVRLHGKDQKGQKK